MDLHALALSFAASLADLAHTPVGWFVLAVFVDVLFGVGLALRKEGLKGFSPEKFSSFLASQFGTKKALVLAGMVVMAVISAPLGKDLAQAAKDALNVGAAALSLGVVSDIKDKAMELFGLPAIAKS